MSGGGESRLIGRESQFPLVLPTGDVVHGAKLIESTTGFRRTLRKGMLPVVAYVDRTLCTNGQPGTTVYMVESSMSAPS